jgi:hypothetical protein
VAGGLDRLHGIDAEGHDVKVFRGAAEPPHEGAPARKRKEAS